MSQERLQNPAQMFSRACKLAIVFMVVCLLGGCMAHRAQIDYVYKVPVAVLFESLCITNDSCIAAFKVTNLSESSVWFEDLATNLPVYSVQWKGHYYGLPEKPDDSCCGASPARKMKAGESIRFDVPLQRRASNLEPFRVGVWVWTSASDSIPQDVFWSDFVSP
jgi:hypothetical protein